MVGRRTDYGAATFIGFSRMYDDVHWFTDVVAGAALGTFIAKSLHRLYQEPARDWFVTGSTHHAAVHYRFGGAAE